MKIYLNGEIINQTEAKISVLDRSYLFGEGLFETLRSYDGKIPFLDKHLERMEWASAFVGINFHHPVEIRNGIKDLLEENKLKEARIKIILSMEGDSFKPVDSNEDFKTNLVISTEEFTPFDEDLYEKGVSLIALNSVKNEGAPVSTLKSTSWLTKIIAAREINEKKKFDGIMLNHKGQITEATKSNLFWIKDEIFYTAPTNLGVLPGITRDIVIEEIKDLGFEFKEKIIELDELLKADEVFLTSSTMEVMPVGEIDDQEFDSSNLTQKIKLAYQERVQEELE
jgi:branched-subunit amino acid aminotransferase/4-amino-4-deoxychorismate lyase